MSASRTKLIASVFLSVLLCVFGCISIAQIAEKGSEGQAPIRSLQIIIDVNRREELFDQLQKFAAKHSFRLLIREVEVIPEGIFIEKVLTAVGIDRFVVIVISKTRPFFGRGADSDI